MRNLDILIDLDDAANSIYLAADDLRSNKAMVESKELIEIADKIIEFKKNLRDKYGKI